MTDQPEQVADDRRARLAALRKKRGQPKDSQEAKDSHREEPQTTRSDHEVTETAETVELEDKTEEPPTIQLDNETVEALSSKIQEEILSQARALANDTQVRDEAGQFKKASSSSLTKDLKDDIQEYTRLAKMKTDNAIYKILQSRVEISEEAEES